MDHEHVDHERSDVNVRGILMFGGGLFAVMVVVGIVIWLFFRFMNGPQPESVRDSMTEAQELRLPPDPQLQKTPREDLRKFRAAEDAVLNRYEWVDREAGVVRIPITEAMKLIVQRGLPARQNPEPGK